MANKKLYIISLGCFNKSKEQFVHEVVAKEGYDKTAIEFGCLLSFKEKFPEEEGWISHSIKSKLYSQ